MTHFLKSAFCVIALGASTWMLSCDKSAEEAREEANASIVNVEKGVASPVWTSDETAQEEATFNPEQQVRTEEIQQENVLEEQDREIEAAADANSSGYKGRKAAQNPEIASGEEDQN